MLHFSWMMFTISITTDLWWMLTGTTKCTTSLKLSVTTLQIHFLNAIYSKQVWNRSQPNVLTLSSTLVTFTLPSFSNCCLTLSRSNSTLLNWQPIKTHKTGLISAALLLRWSVWLLTLNPLMQLHTQLLPLIFFKLESLRPSHLQIFMTILKLLKMYKPFLKINFSICLILFQNTLERMISHQEITMMVNKLKEQQPSGTSLI